VKIKWSPVHRAKRIFTNNKQQIETDFLVSCITLRYATLRDNDAPNNTITTTIIIYDLGHRRRRHPVVPREILERNIQ